MWNFSFRVRKQKIDRNGLAPIELTININREEAIKNIIIKSQKNNIKNQCLLLTNR